MSHSWKPNETIYLLAHRAKPIADIAASLNRTERSVRHKLNRLDDNGKKSWDQQDLEFLKKWFPIFGSAFCKRKLGLHEETINYICLKHKIKMDRDAEYDIKDYFDGIFDSNVVYILGLAWADGCLYKVSKNAYAFTITLRYEDSITIKKHLSEKIWKHLKWNHYTHTTAATKIDGRRVKPCKVMSHHLCDLFFNKFLFKMGYDTKSGGSASKILSFIPKSLHKYWWRGYLDGDGYIAFDKKRSAGKVGFCSTIDQNWDFAESLCKILSLSYSINRRSKPGGHGYSQFLVRRRNDVNLLLDWIYSDYESESIGFVRKYERYVNTRRPDVEKTSGVVGVCRYGSRWLAYRRGRTIGSFASEEAAISARELALQNENC